MHFHGKNRVVLIFTRLFLFPRLTIGKVLAHPDPDVITEFPELIKDLILVPAKL